MRVDYVKIVVVQIIYSGLHYFLKNLCNRSMYAVYLLRAAWPREEA